nr:acyltransferase family protein [Pseudonocardia sp. C8]
MLSSRFDPRRNGFDVLRLLFATLVAVTHGIAIHTGSQPMWGNTLLGDLALDGFFILSGFLVTRSFLRLDSPARYLWHRFLRIMPGFWVCLVVVAVVVAPLAALLRGLPAGVAFTGEPSALRYVLANAGLLIVQYDIAGILDGTPEGPSFNGALWTLFFEAACYGLVLVLGVLGVLRRRRRRLALVLTAGFALLTVLQEAGVDVLVNDRALRLGFVFVLGALGHLFDDRIVLRVDLLLAAGALFAVSLFVFEDYRVLGAAPLAYVFLWFGTWDRVSWSMRHDLSYGVYIYHWPTHQLVHLTALSALPTAVAVAAGLLLTLPAAAASWFVVERRALRLKNAGGRGRHRRCRGVNLSAR